MTRRMLVLSLSALAVGLVSRGGPAPADEAGEPLVVVTHVDVLPKFTEAGRGLLRRFVAESRDDPGAVRVEAFEEVARPNHATIVSVWKTRAAFDAHLAAGHTKSFRAELQPMLGSPFDERLHRPVR